MQNRWSAGGTATAGMLITVMAGVANASASPEWVPGELIVGYARHPAAGDLNRVRNTVPNAASWRNVGRCNTATRAIGRPNPLACARVVKLPDNADVLRAAKLIGQLPGVLYAHPNYIMTPAYTPQDTYYASRQYAPIVMGLDQAWDITTGSDEIIVAVADSGLLTTHEDLQGVLWQNDDPPDGIDNDANGYIDDGIGWDFMNQDNDPAASSAHGTHVTGIIAANIDNALGVAGIARCKIMPLQVFDGDVGTWESIAEAIVYAVDNGARVVNYSGGGAGGDGLLADAVRYAWENNVTVVASSGNHQSSTPYYPAAYPEAIAVSASGMTDNHYVRSGTGPHIDVAAPGIGIWSTLWGNGDDYGYMTGTSMACAQVTGIVALMYSLNPDLDVTEVRQILRETAVDAGAPGFDELFGFGRVDAMAALSAVPLDELRPYILHDGGLLTRPASGYIDPRNESADGLNVDEGTVEFAITFNEPVRDRGAGPDGSLTASSFSLWSTSDTAPQISFIDASANPSIRVRLTSPIPVGAWTTIVANVEDLSGNPVETAGDLGPTADEPDRIDVGFLPGDVDQDGKTGPFDVLRFRTIINAPENIDSGAGGFTGTNFADMNRNGIIEPNDVLTLRQLIRGVMPATRSWAGARLPARP